MRLQGISNKVVNNKITTDISKKYFENNNLKIFEIPSMNINNLEKKELDKMRDSVRSVFENENKKKILMRIEKEAKAKLIESQGKLKTYEKDFKKILLNINAWSEKIKKCESSQNLQEQSFKENGNMSLMDMQSIFNYYKELVNTKKAKSKYLKEIEEISNLDKLTESSFHETQQEDKILPILRRLGFGYGNNISVTELLGQIISEGIIKKECLLKINGKIEDLKRGRGRVDSGIRSWGRSG